MATAATKADITALNARIDATNVRVTKIESLSIATQFAALTQKLNDLMAAEHTSDDALLAQINSMHVEIDALHVELVAAEKRIVVLETAPVVVPPVEIPPVVVPPFAFETPTTHDVITDQDAVTVVFTINPGIAGLIANVKGNGKSVVTLMIPGFGSDWFTRRPELDTPKGGKAWVDGHATGDIVNLYDCADSLFINATAPSGGSTGGTPPIDTIPPPAIELAPDYPHTYDDTLTTEVKVSDMVLVLVDAADGIKRTFRGDDPTTINLGRIGYVGKFTQENVRLQLAGYPVVVYFRPDVGGTPRWEFDVELGSLNIQDKTIPADNLKFSSLQLFVQGNLKYSLPVDQVQVWGQAWRKHSADRPLLDTPENLVAMLRAAKLIPPYKRLDPGQVLPVGVPPATPLGFSSIVPYQGQTGERYEIGLEPEHTAAFVATYNKTALNSMMAWAECAGSMAINFRDKDTGAPPDFVNNPYWAVSRSYYWDQGYNQTGTPLNLYAPDTDPDHPAYQLGLAGNHMPSLSAIPYYMTGDPWHLERQQFVSIVQHCGSGQNVQGLLKGFPDKTGPTGEGEPRGFAWQVRDFAKGEMTINYYKQHGLGNLPLLPINCFQKMLAGYMVPIFRDFVNNTDVNSPLWPLPRFFGICEATTRITFWEEDYLGNVLCWLSEAPISTKLDWEIMRKWKFKSNIARCDINSGWPVRHQTVYELLVLKDAATGIPAKDWADLARLNNVPQDGVDGDLVEPVDGNYLGEQVANLGYGVVLGDTDCVAPYAWIKTKASVYMSKISWRNSIGP